MASADLRAQLHRALFYNSQETHPQCPVSMIVNEDMKLAKD